MPYNRPAGTKRFHIWVGGAPNVKKADLLLLLLHACGCRPIASVTRLSKLAFPAQEEVLGSPASAVQPPRFEFTAHRFGPFSQDVCDEVGFLVSVGMAKDKNGEFMITGKGARFVEQRVAGRVPADHVGGIEQLKQRYIDKDLQALLRHVYTEYPAYTVRSEILGRATGA